MDCGPAKKFKKRFQRHWYDADKSLKVWLEEVVSDESKCYCKVCNKVIGCGLSEIRKHSSRKVHIKNIEQLHSSNTKNSSPTLKVEESASEELEIEELEMKEFEIDEFDQGQSSSSSLDEKIKIAEIRYAAFFAEQNIPLSIASDFLVLMQDIGQEPRVLQGMKIGRTKCRQIINNVLSIRETERIVGNVQNTKFSIYEGETSDSTQDKWFTLVVRYVEPRRLSVTTELLQLIHIDASDCSAEKIFKSFENQLSKMEIPLKNIAGLSCNNALVMTDKHSSFKSKLLQEVPDLVLMPCVCYSVASAANAACAAIPKECLELLRGVVSFIKNSPKRTEVFQEFQETYQNYPLKGLKLPDIHWLALHECFQRFLQIWDDLAPFFDEQLFSVKSEAAKILLSSLGRHDIKGYFYFLEYTLNILNTFTATFQSRHTMVHELQPSSTRLLQFFLGRFLKPLHLENFNCIRQLDFSCKSLQVPLRQVDLGSECEEYLEGAVNNGMSEVEVYYFRKNCVRFYITLSNEIRDRLPHDDPFLEQLTVFKPTNVFNGSDRDLISQNLLAVAERLGNFNAVDLQKEWDYLYYDTSSSDKDNWSKLSFDDMWMDICNREDPLKNRLFPNLTKLLSIVRCLPHSNAESERIFSMFPEIKSKKRNKVGMKLLDSICVVRTSLNARHETSRTMSIDNRHLRRMSGKHLYANSEFKYCKNPQATVVEES